MTDSTRAILREHIVENFLFGDAGAMPADNESLLESGIIDSTGVLELVAFLEDRFGLTMSDADITPENLDSLDAIARFVGTQHRQTLAA